MVLWAVLGMLLASGVAHARCFGVPETIEEVWSIPVYATSPLGFEDEAVFGVVIGATNLLERGLDEIEAVAGPDTRIRTYLFLEQILRFPPAKLNKSFIAPSDNMVWTLKVEYLEPTPSVVSLRWVPDEARQAAEPVTLQLLDGPTIVDMLAVTSHEYNATPGTRVFTILARPAEQMGDGLLILILVVAAYGAVTAAYVLFRYRRKARREKAD